MKYLVPRATKDTQDLELVTDGEAWRKSASASERKWLEQTGFSGKSGEMALIPGDSGLDRVVFVARPDGSPWPYGSLATRLPPGRYRIVNDLDADTANQVALGFALGTYAFDRYRARKKEPATLVWPAEADRAEVTRLVESTFLVRDLINTPAGDLGPDEMAETAKTMGQAYKAKVTVIRGQELLRKNYPTVHMVGRAASRPPCLIDLRWGKASDPKVTLVGKGVVFDSGGLDLKPASGMLLMKKDMGGGAMVLGLARAIMDAGLRVRLRVLVPAVENAVSGDAFRPLDVVKTRKGITVEVGNTDAEGRLIMCDALDEACQENPEILFDFATLTGAARVALGTELPALFASDDSLANDIIEAGLAAGDPLWRLPLHRPYRALLDSKVADINNVGESRFGGAITAALFLQEFVKSEVPWAHVDVMAWNTSSKPGRFPGGEAMGLRAAYGMLKKRYGAAPKRRKKG